MAGINTNGKMEITELDFDNIKSNFKTYLKGQSHFTDYDFEGSGINILLDVLAYNTHYNAFIANMMANEMFLDTAVKRNSVVSHAKSLGYTPTSIRASVATIQVQVNDANTSSITLPEGYAFNTTIDGVTFQFVNITERTIQPVDGVYSFGTSTEGIPIYEGTWVKTEITKDTSNVDQRFIIPNKNVDISTLQVSVQNSSNDSTTNRWSKANNMVDITSTTKAFFVQENEREEWEIYFGDDVIGKNLIDGNIVIMKYIVTNDEVANGATSFSASSSIDGFHNIVVTTVGVASGGAKRETEKSIKTNAPFSYTAQNRTVTSNDYKAIVPKIYPNVESISVWGGEYESPPVYGKVIISIKPKSGYNLTETTKQSIVSTLEKYNVASITPVIVEPEITKIIPNISFKYNNTVTTKTKEDLVAIVKNLVVTYSDDELEKHESIFRYSSFLSIIDRADTSILSNITTIKISKTFKPTIDVPTKYTINFENSFYDPPEGHSGGIVSSSGFKYTGDSTVYYFDDDGLGGINSYYLLSSTKIYKDGQIGTVNYETGEVVLDKISIASVENYDSVVQSEIRITCKPKSNDIVPVRDQILEIDSINTAITGEVDTVSSGGSESGTIYSTVSSFD